MNHRYSTYALLLFALLFTSFTVLGELVSDEVDDLCRSQGINLSELSEYDVLVLTRVNGSSSQPWKCSILNDLVLNVTVNNITNIYNNLSVPYLGANRNVDITPYNLSAQYFVGDGSLLTNLPPGTNPFNQSLNTTDNVSFDQLNVTSLNVEGLASIGTGGEGVLEIDTNLTDTNPFSQIITANHLGTAVVGTMKFVMELLDESQTGSGALILNGLIQFNNETNTHGVQGIKMQNAGGSTQSGGTRTIGFYQSNPSVPILGTGGTTIITGFEHIQNGAIFQMSGDQEVYLYGLKTESGSNTKAGGDGSIFDYGIHLEGYSSCTGCNESLAIKVVDGDSYFNGDINVSSSGNYIHNNKVGITGNYDTGGGCYFNVTGGIIVGSNCTTL
jgi:hypothetical protein